MIKRKLLSLAVAGALALFAQPAAAAAVAPNRAVDAAGLGAVADPLLAIEANRSAIVERLVVEHRATLFANGIDESSFRNALYGLRADHLLAASLVHGFARIAAIVNQVGDLQAGRASMVDQATYGGYTPKDGSGSGVNSWIGYVAGSNVASGPGSAVAAGTFNTASGQGAFIGAGQSNVASGISSLVIGGFDNHATVIDSTVGAGAGNRATGARSVVVGGGYNLASGQWSFIGGGGREIGSGAAGASAQDHIASGNFSAIAGGQGNRAGGTYSAIAGGLGNVASGIASTVAGGDTNVASNLYSTVSGGFNNLASGGFSAIAGGIVNIASGAESFVAGSDGIANQNRCGILAFWSGIQTFGCLGVSEIVRVGANRGFSVDYSIQRPDGGGTRWIAIGDTVAGQTIATWTGGFLSDGGVWTNASDRALKDDFAPVNPRDVLQRVAALPIQRWHYKAEGPGVTHIGPVAQDFHAAFGLGTSDKAIGTVDADGVALAAIQGLYQELQERDARIASQQQRIASLEQQWGEMAATQLQMQDMAQLVLKLQQEMALLRQPREVALAPR